MGLHDNQTSKSNIQVMAAAKTHTRETGHYTVFMPGQGWLCEACDGFDGWVFGNDAVHIRGVLSDEALERIAGFIEEQVSNEVTSEGGNIHDMIQVASYLIEMFELEMTADSEDQEMFG